MRMALAAVLGAALGAACSSGAMNKGTKAEGAMTQDIVHVDSVEAAKRAVGKRVRIEGTARNAKMSAVVLRGDLTVYCLDRDSWAPEIDGKPVTVGGILEYTHELQAQISPSGEIGQGTDSGVFVLRKSEVP